MGKYPTDLSDPSVIDFGNHFQAGGFDVNIHSKTRVADPRGGGGLDPIFAMHGTQVTWAPGATIAAQGHPVDHVYRVLRGCVRTCFYSENGDRRILRFLGGGQYLGLKGAATWSASHEAADTVVAAAVPRPVFEAALRCRPAAQAEVRADLAAQIDAQAALLMLTAHGTALERVRTFLTGFAARRPGGGFVSLPMGRRDIADHLGLSMETVSRSISHLRETGEIDLRGATFFRVNGRHPAGGLSDAA